MPRILATRVAATAAVMICGCSGDLVVRPLYNHSNGRIVIDTNQDLGGKTIYTQARRGKFGTLDCNALASTIPSIAGGEGKIDGPFVDAALTKPFYGPEWGNGNPTPAMIAAAQAGTDSIIDLCVFDGSDIIWQQERDLF